MKCVFVIAVVASLAMVTLGAPATNEIQWTEIANRVQGIAEMIAEAEAWVVDMAREDNLSDPEVVLSIERKLRAIISKANDVLDQIRAAISRQSLTEDEARNLFAQLDVILDSIRHELSFEFSQLSSRTEFFILSSLAGVRICTQNTAKEIFDLLNGWIPSMSRPELALCLPYRTP